MPPKKKKKTDDNSDDLTFDLDSLTICKACKKTFKSVLIHLERTKTDCKSHYTKLEHSYLQKESDKKSKARTVEYNNENRKLIAQKQGVYNSEHRTEIQKKQAVNTTSVPN